MSGSLLSRARACEDGRGLELWRKLHAEWRGSTRQVIAAKARKFHDPQRCQSMQQLWEALPLCEQVGSDVLMEGYVLPEWVKEQALDKLVPQEQLSVTESRPELADYGVKLLRSRHRWNTHAVQHDPAGLRSCSAQRDQDGDVNVGSATSRL